MVSYREEKIDNIKDFVGLIDEEKDKAERSGNDADFIFRGQRRDKPLLPKLGRI